MPKVFISHASADRERIERDVLPLIRNHGIETWYSSHDIPSASDWEKTIRSALSDCDWFLVALSPRALVSDWVQAEVHWALDHRKERFVSLILDACTPSDLHLKLIRYQHIDFRLVDDASQRRLVEAFGTPYQDIPQLMLNYRVVGSPADAAPVALVISDSAFVGRASDCAIRASSSTVSRRHAVLYVKTRDSTRTLWVADMRSTSGTFHNSTRVETQVEVRSGDRIAVGEFAFDVVSVVQA